MEPKNCPHPSNTNIIKNNRENNDDRFQIFSDGSKNESVGVGIAIFIGNELREKIMVKLDNRCSCNQTEQLAILKASESVSYTHL